MTNNTSLLFSPLRIRGVELPNRIAMSPMSMYSCKDGLATEWHIVHLGSRAIGGAGLIMAECTAISPDGRIGPGDLGLWSDAHVEALKPVTAFISEQGSVPAIQISHAGRKGGRYIPWISRAPIPEAEWGHLIAPSALAFEEGWQVPRAVSEDEITQLIKLFASAAERAVEAGFRVVEIHAAHGYLLHQFLSPISNKRSDGYGGSLEARARFPREVVRAVRASIPQNIPVFVRLSMRDWLDGGISPEDAVRTAALLAKDGVDLIDCSSGAIAPGESINLSPGYHAAYSSLVRAGADLKTGVVGLITEAEQAEAILQDGAADLIIIGRKLLREPYWPRRAADALREQNANVIPVQYARSVSVPGKLTQW
ncbi:NADH:flavin oxidoreductase/NADH oxidase [Sulfitobacter sp. 20_GPM-1509m]|uniref:NADH:flavin oxidoreductase/NADH oxidase n=1 Tax=Sulfitobacter sp. 20_GPM-1509m TaxID=1380367 RepID=UPI00048D3DBE|nr:NADH:flavin oxidoreductase/NADH oxidase [Sulfitobacter sp. 20_GPM-1509m]